jgi:DNA mismatch endonuclease, patch repair protein
MEKQLRRLLPQGKFISVSPSTSRNMSAVRGRGNKTTETRLRLALVRRGISGWTLHPKLVYGNPDFFFPINFTTIFVDGCFWHGCPTCGHIPKTRSAFWSAKIERTKERDKAVTAHLESNGFVVLRFWEHQLIHDLDDCLLQVLSSLWSTRLR